MPRTRFLLAACQSIVLALPISLTASPAFSQPTKSATVCLPVAQAAKIADSLRVLPVVRREAGLWQAASDSLRVADAAHYQAFQQVRGALQDERLVTANETAKVAMWQRRARNRSLLNYLLTTLLGGVVYFSLKP